MKVNVRGTEAVLNVAAQLRCRVFTPSTIAVFGPSTPRDMTPNDTVLRPTTIYGTTKVYGELLGKGSAGGFRAASVPHESPVAQANTTHASSASTTAVRGVTRITRPRLLDLCWG